MNQNNRKLLMKSIATQLTTVLTFTAFTNYAIAAPASRVAVVSQPGSTLEQLKGLLDAQDAKIDDLQEELDAARQSQVEAARLTQELIERAQKHAASPVSTPSEPGQNANSKLTELQKIAAESAKDQPALAGVLNKLTRPDGPLLGTVDAQKKLQGLAGVVRDTPEDQVKAVIKDVETDLKEVAKVAVTDLKNFRGAVKDLGPVVLDELTQKALEKLPREIDPKLRQTIESFLTPKLRGDLARGADLRAMLTGLAKNGQYPELFAAILQSQDLLSKVAPAKLVPLFEKVRAFSRGRAFDGEPHGKPDDGGGRNG